MRCDSKKQSELKVRGRASERDRQTADRQTDRFKQTEREERKVGCMFGIEDVFVHKIKSVRVQPPKSLHKAIITAFITNLVHKPPRVEMA